MVGRETKRKKKKEQKRTEDGIVGRLAKSAFIDKDKVEGILKKKSYIGWWRGFDSMQEPFISS